MSSLISEKDLGKIIYLPPKRLRDLTSEQRMRVLRARAERAKEICDERLIAFAQKIRHGNMLSIPQQL